METWVIYLIAGLVIVLELYRFFDLRRKQQVLKLSLQHNAVLGYTVTELLKDIRRHVKEDEPAYQPLVDDVRTSIHNLTVFNERVFGYEIPQSDKSKDKPT